MHRRRVFVSAVSAVILACLLSFPSVSIAVSRSDADAARQRAAIAKQKEAEAQKQADKLLAETRRLEAAVDRANGALSSVSERMAAANARRSRLETEIAGLRADIGAKQSEITSTQVAFIRRKAVLDQRVDAVYRQGGLFYLEMLLESKSFTDLVARTSFVQQVMAGDEGIMTDLHDTRLSLVKAKGSLDRELGTLSLKRQEIAAEQASLRKLRAERQDALNEQQGAQDAKQSLLADTRANIKHLRAAIAAEEAEASRIERLLANGGGSHGNGHLSGSMTWPAPGHETISSGYGWRVHPILGTRRFHAGIDIAAPSGARIVAAAAGTVIFAGDRGDYGNVTMIDHGNGLVTVYAHQSSIGVNEGDRVKRGQRIGSVGSTGLSTGPHLHFEVRVNGSTRNPLGYL
jgi:murein DD-endopeptidase MepM/ murein hydrolase activator NlpD